MELQLGLALIPTNNPSKSNAFDLNTHLHHPLPCLNKKRAVPDAHDLDFDPCSAFRRTLPLLLWNDHPNDPDDDPNDLNSAFSSNHSDEEEEEEENGLVGWPPLKKRRKILYMQKRGGRRRVPENRLCLPVENGDGFCRGSNFNSRYVKVKMEGVGIARKVDLSLHHSLAALRATLMNMFDETDSDGYRLTYQDMDGDWLLAEDVTWTNFIETVQRIKLEKNYG